MVTKRFKESSFSTLGILPKILPKSDERFQLYESFKKRFGEDGSVMVIGVETNKMFQLAFFQQWQDLATEIKARTIFATHYHELNQLAEDFVRVKNFNVSVKEVGDKIIFMRKLKEGGSEHSFGIHVAQMAGMPNKIVLRANEILHFLEKDKHKNESQKKLADLPKENFQMNLFAMDPNLKAVQEMLDKIDINSISPVEALLKLNEVLLLLKAKK